MSKLNGLEVPAHYNGIGLHDTPGAETATWDYGQSTAHAQELRAHGVTLYKLFGGLTKLERARAYVDQGIVTAMRFWYDKPWGRGNYSWVTPSDQLTPFVGAGVRLFELGWNEFNIAAEWAISIPGADAIAVEVVNAWETGLSRCSQAPGAVPLFPSNTPGGNVDHRRCYTAIIEELDRRGLLDTVQHIAVHPRPHNNPPSTVWTATNTVTFDEWRWIRDQFEAAGVDAYYWATEHGYSLGDSQNAEYPAIDLPRWTDYNWELFQRMNPAGARPTEPELAGVMYWFNAGWGHWGAWAKDALVDSIVPEMPAPSPLWVQMGSLANALAFSRYEEEVPPMVDRAKGIDVSQYQGDINWQAVYDSGVRFALIRASAGCVPDTHFEANYAGARDAGLLVGAYHYLHPTDDSQAGTFARAVEGKDLPLGCWADIEADDLTADKCALFFGHADAQITQPIGIYTSASKFDKYGTPDWAAGRLLWVADWRDITEPVLPMAWTAWEFWQQTSDGAVPGIEGRVDVDVYAGTLEQLYEAYGNPVPEPPEPEPCTDLTEIVRELRGIREVLESIDRKLPFVWPTYTATISPGPPVSTDIDITWAADTSSG